MTEEKNNQNSSFSTFLSGIVLGAALTYLFTTESGRKIKDELLKEGSKLLENVGKEYDKAKTELETKEKEVKKQITSTTQDIQEGISDTTENITDVVTEQIPEEVAKIQKKGRRFFFAKKHTSKES